MGVVVIGRPARGKRIPLGGTGSLRGVVARRLKMEREAALNKMVDILMNYESEQLVRLFGGRKGKIKRRNERSCLIFYRRVIE